MFDTPKLMLQLLRFQMTPADTGRLSAAADVLGVEPHDWFTSDTRPGAGTTHTTAPDGFGAVVAISI